jgi:hypothetical protein
MALLVSMIVSPQLAAQSTFILNDLCQADKFPGGQRADAARRI